MFFCGTLVFRSAKLPTMMMKNPLIVGLTVALVFLILVRPRLAWLPPEQGEAEPAWHSLLAEIAEDPALGGAGFGFSLRDEAGQTVAAWEAELPLIPASTFKTLTTTTALEMLGGGRHPQNTPGKNPPLQSRLPSVKYSA